MKLLIDKSDAAIITSPAAETFGFSKSRFTAWNKVEFPLRLYSNVGKKASISTDKTADFTNIIMRT